MWQKVVFLYFLWTCPGFSKNEYKIKFHEELVGKVAKNLQSGMQNRREKNVRFLMSTPTKVLGQFSHSFEVCLPRRLIFLFFFFRWVFAATLLSVLIIILPGLSFLLCDEIFSSPCFVSPWNHNDGCAGACKVFLYYAPIRVLSFPYES